MLPPTARLDPINEPGKTQDVLAATAAAGATIVSVGGRTRRSAEYLDHIEALAEVHAAMSA